MQYINSPFNDAYLNMAFEEYVFEQLPKTESYFLLWQNKNAVVVGKYQNTVEEINAEYCRQNNVQVVRRLSGGGAMYQDIGNLNFTFIVDQSNEKELSFDIFLQPVINALAELGITAQSSGRNDILIDGKKFSGNSQYNKNKRTMHHGTLLFNSDLAAVAKALKVKAQKIESKGIKSVRSRVCNIKDYAPASLSLEEFKQALLNEMQKANNIKEYTLTENDLTQIKCLAQEKYSTWNWIYGASPAYGVQREKRFDFGSVGLSMNIKNGCIEQIALNGDFFGNGEIEQLCAVLCGCPLQNEEINKKLADINVGYYIKGMSAEMLAEYILAD